MNPGIFYLYEYNNTQKLRNAGFLKITRYYHACTLQFNARGIPVSYADSIKLYVFYMENGQAEAAVLTEITCANHALSARMTSAESQFPGGRPLEKIDGFFLLLPNGHILAAAAPGMVVDAQKLLSASVDTSSSDKEPADAETSEDSQPADNAASADIKEQIEPSDSTESTTSESNMQDSETAIHLEAESVHEYVADKAMTEQNASEESDSTTAQNAPIETDSTAAEDTSTETDSATTQDTSAETAPPTEEYTSAITDSSTAQDTSAETAPSTEENISAITDSSPKQSTSEKQDSPQQNVRKIQRSELSVLPRKYWHLANNSFLLHGYHNYNHLILVQKDGHFWLGVPGIYDPREARAARLFGFPQFTDSYNKYLRLSEEECDPQGNFGYWCCYLK